MLHFAKKNVTPPGGFRFVDPDTDQQFSASNMRKLAHAVAKHRKSNSLPAIENIEAIIEDWICQRSPEGICKDESGRTVSRIRYRTAETAVRTTMAIHKYAKKLNRGIVTRKDAELRAARCVACRFNVPFAGCMSCRGVRTIIDGIKRGQHLGVDKQLHSCAVCGVINEIHVWVDNETISDTTGKLGDYPEACWKRDIVKEDRNGHHSQAERPEAQRRHSGDSKPVLRTRRPRLSRISQWDRPEPRGCCGKSRKRRKA